jgi:hypothetical protein
MVHARNAHITLRGRIFDNVNLKERVVDGIITRRWIIRKQIVRIELGWNYFCIVSSNKFWYEQCQNPYYASRVLATGLLHI